MKLTALLILLLGFQVSAYGESMVAGGTAVPVLRDELFFADTAKIEPDITAKGASVETEFLGDLIKHLLFSVRCDVIRDIENSGEMAVRVSL
jgi:hypothetical protein